MKGVRIKLIQAEATFSHKLSHSAVFTYLLPPPSTVIGMIHNLCRWTSYHKMDVSICNANNHIETYDSLENRWFLGEFKTLNNDQKKRWSVITEKKDGGYQGAINSPKIIHHVADLELILHIIPENQDEIEHIYASVLNPYEYPSLGKHQSIIDIQQVKIVDISKDKKIVKFDGIAYRKYDEKIMFPDFEIISNTTIYNLHKDYTILNRKRIFNDIPAILYGGCLIENENYVYEITDSDGIPIFIL